MKRGRDGGEEEMMMINPTFSSGGKGSKEVGKEGRKEERKEGRRGSTWEESLLKATERRSPQL